MEEKIKEVLAKEGFVEKMLECEEPEQVQALFAAEGVELSLEDIKAVGQSLNMSLSEGDELDEDDLDAVAGGSSGVVGIIVDAVVGIVKSVNWRSVGRRIANWFRRW